MTQIVGIGGKLASGKDAIADHLVEKHGWVKMGMSDPLADALYTLNPSIPAPGWTDNLNRFQRFIVRLFLPGEMSRVLHLPYQYVVDEFGYVDAKTWPEVRRLLQVLGTEVGREMIDRNVWVDMAAKRVREAAASGVPGVILTGVRFPNELEMITQDLSGETWWVSRPSIKSGQNSGHSSERSIDASDFERTILNDGTLEELYQKVDKIVGG